MGSQNSDMTLTYDVPAGAGRLEQEISRGAFQPQPLSHSLKNLLYLNNFQVLNE